MAWKQKNNPTIYKRSQIVLALLLFLLLCVVGVIFWFVMNKLNKETLVETTVIEQNSSVVQDDQQTDEEEKTSAFDAAALQQAVDSWVTSVPGVKSVVVADTDDTLLAVHNKDQAYFTASLYKLYVAYAGYQQIDAGKVDPNEQYINGYTRLECLDVMIRDSYSPCAEKLWNELGKEELTTQLEGYGINNTSMSGLTTTAVDTSLILGRIVRGEGLSVESQTAYLDSMKDQDALYRRGLPSGFSDSVVVYNKVGWNELVEWHDTAIVEFQDGRKLLVSVLTEDVGFAKIAELGTVIEEAVSR
jgi:beta-lactamase class A